MAGYRLTDTWSFLSHCWRRGVFLSIYTKGVAASLTSRRIWEEKCIRKPFKGIRLYGRDSDATAWINRNRSLFKKSSQRFRSTDVNQKAVCLNRKFGSSLRDNTYWDFIFMYLYFIDVFRWSAGTNLDSFHFMQVSLSFTGSSPPDRLHVIWRRNDEYGNAVNLKLQTRK